MDTSPSELILLDGTVSSVIYRNEENGYTILRLEAPEAGEEVTVVGTMPGISPGEGLSVHGQWTRHSTYGEQFRAEIVERRICKEARRTALGFEIAHIGVNTADADESLAVCQALDAAFGFGVKEGNSSNFAGSGVEVMKSPYLGKNGHIAVKTNSIGWGYRRSYRRSC